MSAPKVVIIDYGMGNLHSVSRALEKLGAEVCATSNPSEIISGTHVVLPGVGAFSNAMTELQNLKLLAVIDEVVKRKLPLLGICLGMQLLLSESEEFGLTKGLNIIPGRVIPISASNDRGILLKIPHIGWGQLRKKENEPRKKRYILSELQPHDSVYFVHSFMVEPIDKTYVLADSLYGDQAINAIVQKENVIGCQFHPEKSGEVGLKILRNFLQM